MAGQTITKRNLADLVSDNTGIPQQDVLNTLQGLLDEITRQLAAGNRLEFRDFGVFETVERKPRTALNPKTLEKVPVDRKIVVKFKPGRLMKLEVGKLADQNSDSPAG